MGSLFISHETKKTKIDGAAVLQDAAKMRELVGILNRSPSGLDAIEKTAKTLGVTVGQLAVALKRHGY